MIFNIEPFLRRLDFQVLTEEKKKIASINFKDVKIHAGVNQNLRKQLICCLQQEKKSKLAFSKEKKNYKKDLIVTMNDNAGFLF